MKIYFRSGIFFMISSLNAQDFKLYHKAIIEAGGSPKLTLYKNMGYDSWNNTFSETDFLKWIHSKTKSEGL
tara:strand:- start:1996 stop:2208 length:213 start_codon:yes stop_codon:yes gene_type:complete